MRKHHLIRAFELALLAGLTILSACAGVYFYKFAPGYWFSLSSESQRWADFGTFLGGVAGPLFSMLAFCIATLAMYYQAKQLDVLKQQANEQELLRTIASLSAAVDATLSRPPPMPSDMTHPNFSQMATIDLSLSWIAPFKAFGGTHWDATQQGKTHSDVVASLLRDLFPFTNAILRDLRSMAWCLLRLKKYGGNPDVFEFYRARYAQLVSTLTVLHVFPGYREIDEFFDVTVPDDV